MKKTFRICVTLLAVWVATSLANVVIAQEGLLRSVFDKPVPETRRDLLTIQRAAVEVAKKVAPCTVALQLGEAMGSGVIISEDGLILTASHVVTRPGRDVVVLFPNGKSAKGKSLGMHTSADGALVKITDKGKWPFVPLIEEGQGPKVGDWCLAAGHPGGYDADRSPPIRLGRMIEVKPTVLRTDCPITGGDSGGPLMDMQGRVIGIHSRITKSLTENYHVPGLAYREAWDALMNGDLYPDPIPSQFLALLDRNEDGALTRAELSSELHRGIFDRLVEAFDLDVDKKITIEAIVEKEFEWEVATHVPIDEVENLRTSDDLALYSRDFVRGSRIEELFEQSFIQRSRSSDSGDVSRSEFQRDVNVRVYADGRRVSLGTIVDSAGFILTKASRIDHEIIACSLPDGRRLPADLVATDPGYDLALLHVNATDLNTPNWTNSLPEAGAWVAIPNTAGRLESLGVVGVAPRKIKKMQPLLGVRIDENIVSEAVVDFVVGRSGADEAGIQVGDIIINVAGERIVSADEIRELLLKNFRAGDTVDVVIQREDKRVELNVLLRAASDAMFSMSRWQMTGRLSRWRDGFAAAFQIDATIKPEFCGGLIVDIDGKAVGITLARADRVASYCVGYNELQPVLDRMLGEAQVVMTKAKTSKPSEVE